MWREQFALLEDEQIARAGESAPDRRLTAFQKLGRLGLGFPLEIAQQQWQPVFFGQTGDLFVQDFAPVVARLVP